MSRPLTHYEWNSLFLLSVAEGDYNQVKECLEHGANVHEDNDLAICSAVYLGHLDILEILLDYKADVHTKREEPLYVAICKDDPLMINMLLKNGANVDFLLKNRKKELDSKSRKIITEIQLRTSKVAFNKNTKKLKKKAKKTRFPKPGR